MQVEPTVTAVAPTTGAWLLLSPDRQGTGAGQERIGRARHRPRARHAVASTVGQCLASSGHSLLPHEHKITRKHGESHGFRRPSPPGDGAGGLEMPTVTGRRRRQTLARHYSNTGRLCWATSPRGRGPSCMAAARVLKSPPPLPTHTHTHPFPPLTPAIWDCTIEWRIGCAPEVSTS